MKLMGHRWPQNGLLREIGAGNSGPQTIVGDSNFNITGEPLPNSGLSSQTNPHRTESNF